MEKAEGQKSLGRLMQKWQCNIKIDLKDRVLEALTGFNWVRTEASFGHIEHSNELSGSVKLMLC